MPWSKPVDVVLISNGKQEKERRSYGTHVDLNLDGPQEVREGLKSSTTYVIARRPGCTRRLSGDQGGPNPRRSMNIARISRADPGYRRISNSEPQENVSVVG